MITKVMCFEKLFFFQATKYNKACEWKKMYNKDDKKRRVYKLTIKIEMATVQNLLYKKKYR